MFSVLSKLIVLSEIRVLILHSQHRCSVLSRLSVLSVLSRLSRPPLYVYR